MAPAFYAHFIGLGFFLLLIAYLVWRDEYGPKG